MVQVVSVCTVFASGGLCCVYSLVLCVLLIGVCMVQVVSVIVSFWGFVLCV